ncbi:DNA-binding response regulator KdpE (fragment) [Burkholderia sp. 8Y]
MSELTALIRAHVRRRNRTAASKTPVVSVGDVAVHLALRRVTRTARARIRRPSNTASSRRSCAMRGAC